MKILIVDDESDITEIVEFLIKEKFPINTQTLLAYSGNEAISILSQNKDIDICICDHNMPGGMGTEVLKYMIEAKSKTEFVLCSTILASEKPLDYPAQYVLFGIQKPDIEKGIEKLLKHVEKKLQFVSRPAFEEYLPVSVHILSLMDKLPADIYIRMSDNKFIKCIKQNEQFDSKDKEKYLQKSMAVLYIKKEEQNQSINEIVINTVQKIMDRRNMPLADKMNIAYSQLMNLISFSGMTPELAVAAQLNIEQSVFFLSKSSLVTDFWKEMNLLGEYPAMLYTLHSMLSSLVVKKLHWNSNATMYKLTLSAFLKDISLDSIALIEICDFKEFQEKESKFTSQEISRYREHPHKVVEILGTFKEIPPDVDRVLFEQHEMPDGTGFPRKLNANQLGPLTCVFILTGIWARHILSEKKAFDIKKFVKYLEDRGYSRGNFKEGFDAIKAS